MSLEHGDLFKKIRESEQESTIDALDFPLDILSSRV